MKTKLYRHCCIAVLLLIATGSHAQLRLVENGKPVSRIIADTLAAAPNARAAILLQDFVNRISGATLPILPGQPPQPGDIVLDKGNIDGLTEDGFRLQTDNGILYISGGGDKGVIYGVVTLLEDYLGVAYYTRNTCTFEKRSTITLPPVNRAENPAFRYRQTQSYGTWGDDIYKDWFRLETPAEVFAGGLWVHTFERLLPYKVYGEKHPEYYSLINGERRPGYASQWCLTNPEVLEVVIEKLDSIFRANPDKNLISVSQNDGHDTYCTCPGCKALDEYEGSPSGSLIHFINKLAAHFPDKEFSTLAYMYTMQPPKYVKPLPNVNIMLCNIECEREVPLTDNATGQEFMKALKGWAAISNNIFVWDYGINFDDYVAPFPNFPILQRNMQLFKEHNVTMHFSQIGGTFGGDFSEMRAYMVSKLMWNPYQNADSLMRAFMDGYYGAASPYLYAYEKLLEGALLGSGQRLWIYDSPVSHKDGMLNAHCRKRYNEFFDQAEAAVAGQPEFLNRVKIARLPLQYAELQIASLGPITDPDALAAKLAAFRKFTVDDNVIWNINEKGNYPEQYCDMYAERYLSGKNRNLAKGAPVTWLIEPAEKFMPYAAQALTDEILGCSIIANHWIGWQGTDGAFILDLGEAKEITSIEADFLHQLGAWALLPPKVTYSVSADNKKYETFGRFEMEEERSSLLLYKGARCEASKLVKARYVKVEFEGVKTCPDWHFGVGHPSWTYISEVIVQ